MSTTTAPQPGARIAEKYEVVRVLGQGGMGVVVSARHLLTGNGVAIKLLLNEPGGPNASQRLINEARAALQIKSEHVARVIDVDTLPDGLPYIVMELLDGQDLGERLTARGAFAVDDTVSYALQVLEALAEAHHLGIVHRDLKPANLFVTRRRDGSELVKVLDFGISKQLAGDLSPGDASLTKTGSLLGSPYYMSPEQLTDAKSVDARTDIWSLGVVLFELLSGRLPFTDETIAGLAVSIATRPPPDLRSIAPDVPQGLAAVVRRCLERDRKQRFSDVSELARALTPFAPEEARASAIRVARIIEARPSGGVSDATADEDVGSAKTVWSPTNPSRDSARTRRVFAAAAIATLLVVGAGGFALREAKSSSTQLSSSVAPSPPSSSVAPPPMSAVPTPPSALPAEAPPSAAGAPVPAMVAPGRDGARKLPAGGKVDATTPIPSAARPAGPIDFGGK